ncbi:hypothetical protein KIL84_015852 [Mauremys mutica]|uniref:Uncharacterized protein n=1 Tax=Mauremys mutica TaxID=74926 RepID=A0A9D4ASD9_9SAUR|nr:hypothetical protein KIL84_015852 [Mauremys mutica]
MEKGVFLRALETGILNPQDQAVWTESVEDHCLPGLLVAYSGEGATFQKTKKSVLCIQPCCSMDSWPGSQMLSKKNSVTAEKITC